MLTVHEPVSTHLCTYFVPAMFFLGLWNLSVEKSVS